MTIELISLLVLLAAFLVFVLASAVWGALCAAARSAPAPDDEPEDDADWYLKF